MAAYRETKTVRTLVARLSHGADLLAELTEICQRENIRLGRISGIGALQQARLGYYNQQTRQYQSVAVDRGVEILSLLGNVSLKDGKPFVHAHLVVGDEQGQTMGGHLLPETLLFAGEVQIEELSGGEFARGFDEQTGLTLWQL